MLPKADIKFKGVKASAFSQKRTFEKLSDEHLLTRN